MKKRILSLILALSMVLSVLPLGAFAEGSNQELVMEGGFPVGSNNGTANCDGDGWWYRNGILYLNAGTYDFSYINPKTKAGGSTKQPVLCEIEIQSCVTITGGTFNATVYNGKWNSPGGTISNGIFNGGVTNSGIIKKGTFEGSVENQGTIEDGTFAADKNVRNEGTDATIENGTFEGSVMNAGTLKDGTFNGNVENSIDGKISGGAFSSTSTVQNYNGTIEKGTFEGSVKNWESGTIKGGTFAAGLSKSVGLIFGGVFNGNATLTDGPAGYSITWDKAYSKAKITEVNGVSAEWNPYVVVTDEAKTKVVTITADTDIYSLNGQPIGMAYNSSYPDTSKKTIVTFTMPNENVVLSTGDLVMENGYPVGTSGNGWSYDDSTETLTLTDGTYDFSYTYPQNSNGAGAEPVACAVETQLRVKITGGTFEGEVINNDLGVISGGTFHEKVSNYNGMITGGTFKSSVTSMPGEPVVLNGAITCTDLVMEKGWPKDSDGGKTPCKGDGWEYIPNDPTNGDMLLLTGSNQTGGLFDFSTIGDGAAVECNVFVGKPTAITGGEFNGKVFNNSGILGGTFHGEVENRGPGIIKDGTFKNSVENNGTIEKGTFNDAVKNNRTIENGTFAGSVTNSGTVTGGVFNGNATLINVTGGHNITWDAAYPNAKIEKVNDVSANWAPYVVTSNATTKTNY